MHILNTLNAKINELSAARDAGSEESLRIAEKLVHEIVGMLGVSGDDLGAPALLNLPRVQSEISKFVNAPGFRRQAAAFEIPNTSTLPLDLKFFWLKKTTKSSLSWVAGLTANYEDDPENYINKNIGIDFVFPEAGDRLFVILSSNFKLRVLELHEKLTHTQREIFEQWIALAKLDQSDSARFKEQLHTHLWNSFDYEPTNRQFYTDLVYRFDILTAHLKKQGMSEEDARVFTVRLIGRLLFLWFLRKKSFLNPQNEYFSVSHTDDQTDYYRAKLEPLFFEVLNTEIKKRAYGDTETPFLNGGLFEPVSVDYYKDTALTFPDAFFADLYERLDHYNFTVDEGTSEYEQVAIDPEMLGRVFENLLASLSDETGTQARKARGSFYTPREIVDYMCTESLIEHLKTKLPKNSTRDVRIRELVTMPESVFRDQDHNKRRDFERDLGKDKVKNALDEMRILDPAVGSGAFPIGMLHILVKVYSRLDATAEKNSAKLKRDILSRSLYGVDIDQMAIQICRLRAWLSILVDMENVKKVEPLPNLDFKFVCANTLISLTDEGSTKGMFDNTSREELVALRERYYIATRKTEKNKVRDEYRNKIKAGANNLFGSTREKQLSEYDPFDPVASASFYDPDLMHGVPLFDVVIGNPPYVSTKGRNGTTNKDLRSIYGFADDLYSHFYFRGLQLSIFKTGILSYISSKTFWTIQTKKNLRELLQKHQIIEIFDTAQPFNAMVDTCVVIVKNNNTGDDYQLTFSDGKKNLSNPERFQANISLFREAVNNVFFLPNDFNLAVYKKYNSIVSDLMGKWWLKVYTSREINKNKDELGEYRKNLKPGDVALLGTLTEGGQGLATGNNGKFIGVREGTKIANRIKETRYKKLLKANQKIKDSRFDNKNFLNNKNEKEIRELFDFLKEKYGRDIFGQGYLFRIVSDDEIADVEKLTEVEKKNGIDKSKPHYVSYDKGDKDGNRWWLATPFVIDWLNESVSVLQTDSKARWQGHEFYFREGFCWSDVHTIYIKSRLKSKSVYDVKSMSMFSECSLTPDWYMVSILNSKFISEYDFAFVNNTSSFQINDARQLPIIIPTEKQLKEFEDIFDTAFEIKKKEFSGKIKKPEAKKQLQEIQKKLDERVYKLYDLVPKQIKTVENSK